MKRILSIFLLLFCALRADYDFVTAVSLTGGVYNDRLYLGTRATNTTGTDIVITQLGRWVTAGNSQTHALILCTTTDATTPVRSVTVNTSGAPSGQFLYGAITPYTLTPGSSVYVMTTETLGGDLAQGALGGLSPVLTTPNICTTSTAATGTGGGTTISTFGNSGGTYTGWGVTTFRFSAPSIPGWTKAGTVYTTNGFQYAVTSAIADATAGDQVNIAAGTFTYGGGASTLTINKAIKVLGAGQGSTTINISSDLPTYTAGSAITISSNATFGSLTMVQPGNKNTTAIRTLGANNWRVTDIHYTSGGTVGYFIYTDGFGLIDHNYVDGGNGGDEWVFMRGAASVWNAAAPLGTANAVFIEDNTFYDQGYWDANYAATVVARFNTITPVAAIVKFDMHGYPTNGGHSARSGEMYANYWTTSSGANTSFEIRGGTGLIFANTTINASAFYLSDYGILSNVGAWGNYQTPSNLPLFEQIGSGPLATVNATALVNYQRAQIKTLGSTNWQNIGAPVGAIAGTQFTATGPDLGGGSGDAYVSTITEPMYLWGNRQSSGAAPWARTPRVIGTDSSWNTNAVGYSIGTTTINIASQRIAGSGNGKIGVGDAVLFANHSTRYLVTASALTGNPITTGNITVTPALTAALVGSVIMTSGPLTTYQQQMGNTSATFGEPDIVLSNRNFYADAGFDTNTGVTVGTALQMSVATPTNKNGFWVTNEGSWNNGFSGTIAATAIQARYFCEIVTPGSPSFTTIGAKDNLAGTQFVASGPLAATPGTGTVKAAQGRLYVGNGSSWVLTYTPYQYPHPLQAGAPTLFSATIDTTGSTLTLLFSDSCSTGAGGAGGVTVSATGGASTPTFSSGAGSTSYVYTLSRTINAGETVTVSYTQPGSGIEATTGGADVASFSNQVVTNGSTVGSAPFKTVSRPAQVSGGF